MGRVKEAYYDGLNDDKEIVEEYPAEVDTTGPETKNGIIVNALFVKLRTEPNFESIVVDTLRKGDEVTIISKVNGFSEVYMSTSNNIRGYVSSNFIEEV